MLLASCPHGICIIDLNKRKVITKLHMDLKISNVEFATDGFVYFTGMDYIWRLALRSSLLSKESKEELWWKQKLMKRGLLKKIIRVGNASIDRAGPNMALFIVGKNRGEIKTM